MVKEFISEKNVKAVCKGDKYIGITVNGFRIAFAKNTPAIRTIVYRMSYTPGMNLVAKTHTFSKMKHYDSDFNEYQLGDTHTIFWFVTDGDTIQAEDVIKTVEAYNSKDDDETSRSYMIYD